MERTHTKGTVGHRFLEKASLLRESELQGFSRAIRDKDSFTVFHELTHCNKPVDVETLCKTFGAEFNYISSILKQLQRWGVASTEGNQWLAQEWATIALKALEHSVVKNIGSESPVKRILTLSEVAEFLGVHPSTVYRFLKKQQLPAFKFGTEWRFEQESIVNWAEKRNLAEGHGRS